MLKLLVLLMPSEDLAFKIKQLRIATTACIVTFDHRLDNNFKLLCMGAFKGADSTFVNTNCIIQITSVLISIEQLQISCSNYFFFSRWNTICVRRTTELFPGYDILSSHWTLIDDSLEHSNIDFFFAKLSYEA